MRPMPRYTGDKGDPKFSLLFYFYTGADVFQMPVSKSKMVTCIGLIYSTIQIGQINLGRLLLSELKQRSAVLML